jgi:hypothetical protein
MEAYEVSRVVKTQKTTQKTASNPWRFDDGKGGWWRISGLPKDDLRKAIKTRK